MQRSSTEADMIRENGNIEEFTIITLHGWFGVGQVRSETGLAVHVVNRSHNF